MLKIIFAIVISALFGACGDGGWNDEKRDYRLFPDSASEEGDDDDNDDDSSNGGGEVVDEGRKLACAEGYGNEIGLGAKCETKRDCERGLECDIEMDKDQGIGMCVKLFCKTTEECGSGGVCCKPNTSPANVCIPNGCLPPECEPGGGEEEEEKEQDEGEEGKEGGEE